MAKGVKPRKYQKKLSLYPKTFQQVVDTVLKYKPKKTSKKRNRTRLDNACG